VPLPEWLYGLVFRQPRSQGLSDLGVAAVDAMVEHRVLIDVAHMSQASLDDVFRIAGERAPVSASHGACRFGRRHYNLSRQTIERIGASGGVIGLSASERHLTDGLPPRQNEDFEESLRVIRAHVDRIRDYTGSPDHVAIGSDMDGFVKPTLRGLEHMGRMAELERGLRAHYDRAEADRITSGNALGLLRTHWGGAPSAGLRAV
jgi:microsomal dipeptidase-like Zn-dependent dipeptidase